MNITKNGVRLVALHPGDMKSVSAKYGPERHVLGCIYLCHTLQSVACELLRFKSDPKIYHNLSINQSCCLFYDNSFSEGELLFSPTCAYVSHP